MKVMSDVKKRILIVDDDFDYLTQLKLQIEGFGFDVMTADSRKYAEEKLEDEKPDLAIYDLMMETQDAGFILAYKTKKKYPDVPVIIASAVTAEAGMVFHLDTNADRAWIKADRYLEKGIRGDQLHREINKLLKI
jgi:DNA-binding response OmpR family regulator